MKGFCSFWALLALAPRSPTKGFCSFSVLVPSLQEAPESRLASPGRKIANSKGFYMQSLDFSGGGSRFGVFPKKNGPREAL